MPEFLPAIAAKAESLVMDIVTDVLIRFPIIDHRTKGVHYFHRIVGLEVINIHQWESCHRYFPNPDPNLQNTLENTLKNVKNNHRVGVEPATCAVQSEHATAEQWKQLTWW